MNTANNFSMASAIMKRGGNWIQISLANAPQPWEQSLGIPPEGVRREAIEPLMEEVLIHALGAQAWGALGKHWVANKPAFAELDKLSPDGMEAMARFLSRHLLKRLPEASISEAVFWDEYMLFMAGMAHDHLEQDDMVAAYVKHRTGKPGWLTFLRRFIQVSDGGENPVFGQRFMFCMLWDLYPMPLRFWADAAAADFLSGVNRGFNLDKVRNTRRELGLHRDAPTIVKAFMRKPPPSRDADVMLKIDIDDQAARKCRLPRMVAAFIEFLKDEGKAGS